MPIVTLLTDFGLVDTYVGQMKGVLLSGAPGAALIDLTHAVPPQHVLEGAFHLEVAAGRFPAGTIHLAVVDPGVGTERAALAVMSGDHLFVGPDNGLLSCALPDRFRPDGAAATAVAVGLPQSVRAVVLRPPAGRRVSATFHGRDIFAPAAAALAAGTNLDTLGRPATAMLAFPPFRARPDARGRVAATILTVDRFGNLITDCRAEDIAGRAWRARVHHHTAHGPAATYAGGDGLILLAGSAGYVEVAVTGRSAAVVTGAVPGDPVTIETRPSAQHHP